MPERKEIWESWEDKTQSGGSSVCHFCYFSCSIPPDNTGSAVKLPEWAQPACVGTSIPIPPILKAEVAPHQLTSFPDSSAQVEIQGSEMTATPECMVSQSLQLLRQSCARWG